jgi:hypothetical protein
MMHLHRCSALREIGKAVTCLRPVLSFQKNTKHGSFPDMSDVTAADATAKGATI